MATTQVSTKVEKSEGGAGAASTATTTKKVIVETRTYETESSLHESQYRPNIQARNIIIQRSGLYGTQRGGGGTEKSLSYSQSYAARPLSSGSYAQMSNSGVVAVTQSRQQEKRDMQDLNERLANYIEKVRFLEAQNRKLADELEKLKARWGKETSQIKAMYQAELDEARRILDEAVKEKSRLEIRVASNEEYLEELRIRLEDALREAAETREKIDRQNQMMAGYDGELSLLRKRCESLELERDKEKGLVKKLQDMLNSTRADLDNETLLHIDAENRRQTLDEELEFLKALHEQELKELQALAYRDTTSENREYWKNEMGQALREIQQAYDDKIDGMRGELETHYTRKVQEYQTGATKTNMESVHSKEEVKRLKNQAQALRDKLNEQESKISQLMRELEALRREREDREREMEGENQELKGEVTRLRAEMEAILKELQLIIDTKLGLELEIAAYRRLLEGEESRIGLRHIVDALVSQEEHISTDASMKVNQVVKGEMSAKTTYQKSAKGPVAIFETAADGKYIALENSGRKDENLGSWSIKRSVDGVETSFTFPEIYTLKAGEKSKIWAKGATDALQANDLEYEKPSWETGSSVTTRLVNPAGEDRATHVQKTNYA